LLTQLIVYYHQLLLRHWITICQQQILIPSKFLNNQDVWFLECTPRISPQLRHRVRALSRPEAQLLTPEVLRLREEKKKKLRRNSINVLARDGVHETGSEAFQRAVRRDSIHECHPGWQSLRRMTGVIG